jgi:hypothetical protein
MPVRKPWDHAIDLKETFKPKKGRLIPLSPEEQKEVSDFIDDQLSKKYIYIDKAYAQKMKLPLTLLADPIPVYNVDGTQNAAGSITHCAEIIIQFQEHREKVTAEVTDLGKNQMILGYTWLSHHNPEIDWTTGTVQMTRCPWTCQTLKGKPPFA